MAQTHFRTYGEHRERGEEVPNGDWGSEIGDVTRREEERNERSVVIGVIETDEHSLDIIK